MNLRKINIYKMRDFLDGLIEKIPPRILTPIIHTMYVLAGIMILYGIYFGAKLGYASAKQEGQELGKDTKTLFQEEVERTYNRKKRGLTTASDNSSVYIESTHEIEKIFPTQESPNSEISKPQEDLMKKDEEFRPKQELTGPPLEDISKPSKLPPTKEDKFEIDSGLEDSRYYEKTLRETPNYNYRVIDRKTKIQNPVRTSEKIQTNPRILSKKQTQNLSPPE
ncbi:MAG: hypothetical protein N3A69_09115 [Leptospiraceae bacterium]|nr:hypothetical protein [Leptospiraceae bacterium]